MTKTLEEAMARVGALPLAAQERIGEELLLHIEKLEKLRAKLDRGIGSLNLGRGRPLDIPDVMRRARAQYGKR